MELAGPEDRTVVVADDVAAAREARAASWVIGSEVAGEIRIET